ncbi:hypothetical protein FXO37_15604 [Capsicum annuum]|nr:hypothetical protein FXO37_15604 [Capsicum annuum]
MATDEGGTKNGISASPTNLGLSIGPKLSHPQTPKPNTNNTLLGIKPILLELTTNQFSPIMEPNKENRKRPPATIPSDLKALINQKQLTVTSNTSSLITHSTGNDEEIREVTAKPDYIHKGITAETLHYTSNSSQRKKNGKSQSKLLSKHGDIHLQTTCDRPSTNFLVRNMSIPTNDTSQADLRRKANHNPHPEPSLLSSSGDGRVKPRFPDLQTKRMDDYSHDSGKPELPTLLLPRANFNKISKNEQQPLILPTQGPRTSGIRTTLCEGKWEPSPEPSNVKPTRTLPTSFRSRTRREENNSGGLERKQQRNGKQFGNSQGPKSRSAHLGQTTHSHIRGHFKRNIVDPHSSRATQNGLRNPNSSSEHFLHYQNETTFTEEKGNDGANINPPTPQEEGNHAVQPPSPPPHIKLNDELHHMKC